MGVISHFRAPISYLDKSQNKIKSTHHLQINGFRNINRLYPYLNLIKDYKKRKIKCYVSDLQRIYDKLNKNFNKDKYPDLYEHTVGFKDGLKFAIYIR